ncbi:MAG: protease modulator HflC [Planctomycetes bacterium]|nr:protease modulator HflC [Planctomycetota bacterium]
MKRRWIPITAIALLAIALSSFQVTEGSHAVVTRFGKPVALIEGAGLHFKLPSPIDSAVPIDMRMHLLDPEPGNYLTRDKKSLLVDSFLIWSVDDPLQYYKAVGTRGAAEARLSEVLRSVVGDVLSSYDFEDILTTDDEQSGLARIAVDLQSAASDRVDANKMGLTIKSFQVKRLNFPDQNKRAVFSRMETERQAISSGIRADGKEQYDKIKAQTDREEAELLAEARRKAAEIRGTAEAEAARLYAEAYNADPELYNFVRSLDAAEAAFSGKDNLIILHADHPLLKVLGSMPSSPPTANDSVGGGN